MNKYELIVMVDAQMAQADKEAALKHATDAVAKAEGKVINSQVWMERQRFTYRIKKCWEGTYYLIKFEGPAQVVGKVNGFLKLNEKILRFLIVRE